MYDAHFSPGQVKGGRFCRDHGGGQEEDVYEALYAAADSARDRGDEVEAARIMARIDDLEDLTDQLYTDVRRIHEAAPDTEQARRQEALSARSEAAIEEREERTMEQAARSVLFDVLQHSWSDARYVAERDTLEREEEEEWMAGMEEGEVVEVEDRRREG